MSAYFAKIVADHRKAAKAAAKVQASTGVDKTYTKAQARTYNLNVRYAFDLQAMTLKSGLYSLLEQEFALIFKLAHAANTDKSGINAYDWTNQLLAEVKEVRTKIAAEVAAN